MLLLYELIIPPYEITVSTFQYLLSCAGPPDKDSGTVSKLLSASRCEEESLQVSGHLLFERLLQFFCDTLIAEKNFLATPKNV